MTRKTSVYDMMLWLKKLHNYLEKKGIIDFTAADINEVYNIGCYTLAKQNGLIKIIDKVSSRDDTKELRNGTLVHLCRIDYHAISRNRFKNIFYKEN